MPLTVKDWKRIRYLDQQLKTGGPDMVLLIENASEKIETVEELARFVSTMMDPEHGIMRKLTDTAQVALRAAGWMTPEDAAELVASELAKGQENLEKQQAERMKTLAEPMGQIKKRLVQSHPELLGALNQVINLLED